MVTRRVEYRYTPDLDALDVDIWDRVAEQMLWAFLMARAAANF